MQREASWTNRPKGSSLECNSSLLPYRVSRGEARWGKPSSSGGLWVTSDIGLWLLIQPQPLDSG